MGQRTQTTTSEHSNKPEHQLRVILRPEGTPMSQIDANKKIQQLNEEKEELQAVIQELLKKEEEEEQRSSIQGR